jgi:uncharacterized membrane protein
VYFVEDELADDSDSRKKLIVRVIAALAMIGVGSLHFLQPDGFVKIVPSFFPMPLVLVYVSGGFEILGGIGLLIPRFRRWAAFGLIALYIAVFPANVNMAVNDIQPAGFVIPNFALWARLPFQLVFIGLAWWLRRGTIRIAAARRRRRPPSRIERGLRP